MGGNGLCMSAASANALVSTVDRWSCVLWQPYGGWVHNVKHKHCGRGFWRCLPELWWARWVDVHQWRSELDGLHLLWLNRYFWLQGANSIPVFLSLGHSSMLIRTSVKTHWHWSYHEQMLDTLWCGSATFWLTLVNTSHCLSIPEHVWDKVVTSEEVSIFNRNYPMITKWIILFITSKVGRISKQLIVAR